MGTMGFVVIVHPDNAHIGRFAFIVEEGELIGVDGGGILWPVFGGGVVFQIVPPITPIGSPVATIIGIPMLAALFAED